MQDFKKIGKEINEQIKPRQQFMDNLKDEITKKLENDNYKHDAINNRNFIKNRKRKDVLLQRVAIMFLTVTVFSSCVFGKGIENFMAKLFSNVDKGLEVAIENDYIQTIDSDYIEHGGVAIKVSDIIIDDNNISVIFDVKTEEEIKRLYFIDMDILDENGNIIFSEQNLNHQNNSISRKNSKKNISKYNSIIIENFYALEDTFKEIKKITIKINKIDLFDINKNEKKIEGDWYFYIDVDHKFLNRKREYYKIAENDLIKEYNLKQTSTGLSLTCCFYDKEKIPLKENIFIEDNNGKKYIANDLCLILDNYLYIVFPIFSINDLDCLTLNIDNQRISIFKVK